MVYKISLGRFENSLINRKLVKGAVPALERHTGNPARVCGGTWMLVIVGVAVLALDHGGSE